MSEFETLVAAKPWLKNAQTRKHVIFIQLAIKKADFDRTLFSKIPYLVFRLFEAAILINLNTD